MVQFRVNLTRQKKKIAPDGPTHDRGDCGSMSILKTGRSFLGLALALSVSTAAFADDIKLKIAGTWPTKHFGHEIMENMVKEIEAADVGITVSYFPASQLGSGEELVEDAIRGNVDIVQAFIYAQTDPRLEIMNLPALVTTFDELKAV